MDNNNIYGGNNNYSPFVTRKYGYAPLLQKKNLPNQAVISTFQPGDGWTRQSSGGTLSAETTDFVLGTQSLRLTTPGTASAAVFVDSKTIALNLTNKQFRFLIKVPDITKVDTLWLEAGDSALTNYFRYDITVDIRTLRSNEWCWVTINQANLRSTTGTPDLANIAKIRLRANGNNTGVGNVLFNQISTFDAPAAGVVSVTFDDGYASDFSVAKPIMDMYGFRGTAYVIADSIGKAGRTTFEQLRQLQDFSGWGISAHASPDLTTLDAFGIHDEFRKIKFALLGNGLAKGADHLAYPMGRYNSLVLRIAREYFTSARTIDVQHETTIPADPLRLRVFYVIQSTTAAQVKAEIDKAAANKSWLILVYHSIIPTADGVPESVTTANFTQNMADLAAAGVAVKPVDEVVSGL